MPTRRAAATIVMRAPCTVPELSRVDIHPVKEHHYGPLAHHAPHTCPALI